MINREKIAEKLSALSKQADKDAFKLMYGKDIKPNQIIFMLEGLRNYIDEAELLLKNSNESNTA